MNVHGSSDMGPIKQSDVEVSKPMQQESKSQARKVDQEGKKLAPLDKKMVKLANQFVKRFNQGGGFYVSPESRTQAEKHFKVKDAASYHIEKAEKGSEKYTLSIQATHSFGSPETVSLKFEDIKELAALEEAEGKKKPAVQQESTSQVELGTAPKEGPKYNLILMPKGVTTSGKTSLDEKGAGKLKDNIVKYLETEYGNVKGKYAKFPEVNVEKSESSSGKYRVWIASPQELVKLEAKKRSPVPSTSVSEVVPDRDGNLVLITQNDHSSVSNPEEGKNAVLITTGSKAYKEMLQSALKRMSWGISE